jgi:hypothetical protein
MGPRNGAFVKAVVFEDTRVVKVEEVPDAELEEPSESPGTLIARER